ncbi:FAD/NAD(P)-binding domain-containing protein [Imleria badia]|nr:FAD/NAD(P)-binding domain-containing protein [Imleria badia]
MAASKWLKHLRPAETAEHDSEAVRVIIVGAGYAGLGCAIECKRKGHDVVVLEKIGEFKILGDIISFGANVGHIIGHWGLHDELWDFCAHAHEMRLHDYSGNLIRVQPLPSPMFGSYNYAGHRALIRDVLLRYAAPLGIDIRMGQEVVDYGEDEENKTPGVILRSGETLQADLVVAADGIKSHARKYVLGYNDRPRPSGYAIYRAWFDAKEQGVDTDPCTDFLCKDGDVLYGWTGKDVHFIAASCGGGKSISWGDWSVPGRIEDVVEIAPSCGEWKIIIHDPLPSWVSRHGRVLLIGDADHQFLPSSMQGAPQAIEDCVTLADKVPLAARAWEGIRYERVCKAQKIGETTRDQWHRVEIGDKSAEELGLPIPEWLLAFDAEAHAYSVFDDSA